ncbi:glycosyltransferase [Ligilactobacillus equi]|nr:glycosyltransferase [Ligilactobacillus equi]
MKKAIAFATDAKYIMALETVVKSILLNNDDTTIYVINTDIPVEWFFQYKKILANTSCQVVNVQINDEQLKWDESFSYITKISYARIMLGRLLPQEKRVLYLDGDVVVNGNLDELLVL